MKRADLKVKFLSMLFSNLNLSLINNRTPNTMVVKAIIFISLSFSMTPVSAKRNPIIITGIDEIRILIKITLLFKNFIISLKKKYSTAINEPMCKLTSIETLIIKIKILYIKMR